MRNNSWGQRAGSVLILVGIGLVLACPLPLARTEAISAPVSGRVLREDGTPVAGAQVAMSSEFDDETCTRPTLRVASDSAGRFHLSGTERNYKVTWVIPNYDLALPRYHLCVAVGELFRSAYAGYGAIDERAAPDSIDCVIWELAASPRVSCAGKVGRGVVTGGEWSAGRERGFYRILLTSDSTQVKGFKRPESRTHAYVQWVSEHEAGGTPQPPYDVRAMAELEFDHGKMWELTQAAVLLRQGQWMGSLRGYKHTFMNDMARSEVVFLLGAPGEFKRVAGP